MSINNHFGKTDDSDTLYKINAIILYLKMLCKDSIDYSSEGHDFSSTHCRAVNTSSIEDPVYTLY